MENLSEKIKASKVRWAIFGIIALTGLTLTCIAFFAGGGSIQNKEAWGTVSSVLKNPGGYDSAFTAAEWVALIIPTLSLLTAFFAHRFDDKFGGRGVKDVITKMVGKRPYNLETEVIAASMTKQSVLAAVSATLLALLQGFPDKTTFIWLVKRLADFGFAFSILFLLVSMVCYDYASRFRWPSYFKARLVRKALTLDVLSWYALITSFILSIALINPRLSVLTCVAAGVLMWWYYFFRPEKMGEALAVRNVSKHVIKVKDLEASKSFYCDVLGLEACEDGAAQGGVPLTRIRLRAGSWAEVALEVDANVAAEDLIFSIPEDDLRHAKEYLKARSPVPTPAPADGSEARIFHVIDPDNAHKIEFRPAR